MAPDIYAEAFSAAVDYLGTQNVVDRDRIGVLGICGSGSFVISAAKIDPRMKAIATVSMYDMGAANRDALNHSQTLEQRKAVIAEAAAQRWVEAEGGKTRYTGGTVHQLDADTHPIQREFFDFYRTPRGEFTPAGSSPELTTHPTLSSNVKFMNFYPFNDIETISPRPMLFIAGDRGAFEEFSEEALSPGGPAEGTLLGKGCRSRGPLRSHRSDPVRQAGIVLQAEPAGGAAMNSPAIPAPMRFEAGEKRAHWGGVFAMTLCVFALIASEFMPVSLLTPMAADLRVSEGLTGYGIAISGAFAVLTSLSISRLAGAMNRRACCWH